jgi:hypothetical protein
MQWCKTKTSFPSANTPTDHNTDDDNNDDEYDDDHGNNNDKNDDDNGNNNDENDSYTLQGIRISNREQICQRGKTLPENCIKFPGSETNGMENLYASILPPSPESLLRNYTKRTLSVQWDTSRGHGGIPKSLRHRVMHEVIEVVMDINSSNTTTTNNNNNNNNNTQHVWLGDIIQGVDQRLARRL